MDAHDKGVNHVDFYPGSDKPYLVTTAACKRWKDTRRDANEVAVGFDEGIVVIKVCLHPLHVLHI
jgi:hypothetical protein